MRILRRIAIVLAAVTVLAPSLQNTSGQTFTEGPKKLKPYADFLGELDKALLDNNSGRLNAMIDDQANFVYEEWNQNLVLRRKRMTKAEYVKNAETLFQNYIIEAPRREVINYALSNGDTEGFVISMVTYILIENGRPIPVSFREHHHFSLDSDSMKIRYLWATTYTSTAPIRRLFL